MIDLKAEHAEIVRTILNKYLPESTKVYVYGSRAKGNARPYSDLDLAIDKGGQRLLLKEEASLIDDFVESDLPFKVDLTDWNKLSADFKKIIAKDKLDFI